MIKERFNLVQIFREQVKKSTQWVRHRLCFVMIVKAGELSPALVPAHLYEAGSKLDPEDQPPKDEYHNYRIFIVEGAPKRCYKIRLLTTATPTRSHKKVVPHLRWRDIKPIARTRSALKAKGDLYQKCPM